MKTFEEWCNDREIVLNELSPKLLTMAYKIWGEECFVEGQIYEAENAELRVRLEKAVELPRIIHPNTYEWFVQYQNEYGLIFDEIFYSERAAEARLKKKKENNND